MTKTGDNQQNPGFEGRLNNLLFVTPTDPRMIKRGTKIPGEGNREYVLKSRRDYLLGTEYTASQKPQPSL